MSTPVFVIHGVGARCRDAFTAQATGLATAAGLTDPHPVYWGDLGADYALIDAAVPGAPEPADGVRDATPAASLDPLSAQIALFLAGGGAAPAPVDGAAETRDGTGPAPAVPPVVVAAVREHLQPGGTEVRAAPAPVPAVESALAEAWPGTAWLRLVGDPVLQAAVGQAIAAPVADGEAAEIRGPVGDFLRRRIADVDRVVGAAFGAAGGRLNSLLRTAALPDITRTAGDVIVYQRHRDAIARCVRDAIAAVDPALGRPGHPVDVVAHSLGGVIAVDMATAADDPLCIRRLVTFGSQPAFFHLCDPRGGALAPYTGERLRLPASIGAWTNLWEPLDPLAFLAARVFELHDGAGPTDHRVEHLVWTGFWTHSSYWELAEVARVIAATLS